MEGEFWQNPKSSTTSPGKWYQTPIIPKLFIEKWKDLSDQLYQRKSLFEKY